MLIISSWFIKLCCAGLYLTGGLTPKNINLLKGENSHFMKAFKDKVTRIDRRR